MSLNIPRIALTLFMCLAAISCYKDRSVITSSIGPADQTISKGRARIVVQVIDRAGQDTLGPIYSNVPDCKFYVISLGKPHDLYQADNVPIVPNLEVVLEVDCKTYEEVVERRHKVIRIRPELSAGRTTTITVRLDCEQYEWMVTQA